jgi:mannose/fructose-specific phosphotransferase system component IIA
LEATAGPELGENIADHAAQELTARLMQAIESLDRDGVVFLTDVAFLYP